MMRYLQVGFALIATATLCACVSTGSAVTPSGVSVQAVSNDDARERAHPQSSGPSFVEIDGVEAVDEIASDGVGGEWFGNGIFDQGLVQVDEMTRDVRVFHHPYHQLEVLARGGDKKAMWFGSQEDKVIGSIDLTTHTIKIRTIASIVGGIVAGPQNSIWFTLPALGKIGLLEPPTFVVHYYSTQPFTAIEIVSGSDGALWFADGASGAIGRIDPLTHDVTGYSLPGYEGYPQALTSGPDNAIWFTLFGGDHAFGRLDVKTHHFTFYNDPGTYPYGMVTRHSKIWFADNGAIGEITPSTGAIQVYNIPNHSNSQLWEVTLGDNDQLWATELKRAPHLGSLSGS